MIQNFKNRKELEKKHVEIILNFGTKNMFVYINSLIVYFIRQKIRYIITFFY